MLWEQLVHMYDFKTNRCHRIHHDVSGKYVFYINVFRMFA